MWGKIEGQRLRLAKMYIADYCLALREESGNVDIPYVVARINNEFHLVPESEMLSLINDIGYFFHCLDNQQVEALDRGGYWKWKAVSALEAKAELERNLNQLQA
ncbi:hypothetical protein [Halomonas saccharevitans]|uniref:Uncharacterized protein n=1 Tax=Halomonas saccharevitans TaxID=416872 RepID=A0A1I6YW96_9GAMM|nr:hypothetical protein [Halomonas saccharevitans]SFT54686.1 hypothetical protein SAMN04487956_10790 [Halomonas saccharevitans]